MIKSKPCKECGSIYHTKMYHNPRKPIARTALKAPNTKEAFENVAKAIKRTSKNNSQVVTTKKKKTTRAKAKEKAWTAFSAYIRTRDCLRFTGSTTEGKCVTCRQAKPYKDLQAGHFVGGRGNAVLFDERIVYSQCGYCNQKPPVGLGGNYAAYTLWMQDEGYTREQIEEFLNLRHTTKVYKQHDFEEIKATYEEKTKLLIGE